MQRFDYNSAFEVTNVRGFATAVQRAIGASTYRYAKCVYRRTKIFIVNTPIEYQHHVVVTSAQQTWADMAQYFLKPERFQHQGEFRIVWQMPPTGGDVEPVLITCPEARQYCKRLK